MGMRRALRGVAPPIGVTERAGCGGFGLGWFMSGTFVGKHVPKTGVRVSLRRLKMDFLMDSPVGRFFRSASWRSIISLWRRL
jgi:hypothetical protein